MECKALGKLTSKCIDIKELSFDEYLKKYGLTSEEYVKERNLTPSNPDDPASVRLSARLDCIFKSPSECSCRLPSYNADNINKTLAEDKDECFKRHQQ